ncbi:MAG: hypothetical protein JKY98_06385 [Gammaproteobacteria bacterium]|nr:hypothetical protein [Gammaproteobacteria bacterium]
MKKLIDSLAILLLFTLFVGAAQSYAIPAFTRKEGIQCSGCHSAFPALNSLGRTYKTQGYHFREGQSPGRDITSDLSLDEMFPVSAGIISRPYDKKDSGETKNRAIHEVEIMIAGHFGNGISGFIELEAEDEDDFNTSASIVQGTYNVNRSVNIQVSRAPAFYFDPYNSYTSSRRSTINRNVVIDQSFGGADNGSSLRKKRQNITVFGRPFNNLFYGVSYSGTANDNEGVDADTYLGRVAYNLTPSLMIGGMALSGTCSMQSAGGADIGDPCNLAARDYTRYAIDTQWTTLNNRLILNAVYMQADDDLASGFGDESNTAFYVQGFYNFLKDGRPLFTPVLRYDSYEANDGRNKIKAWTAGLSHYLRENIKIRAELSTRDGDGTILDDDRFTIQIDAFF